jgi:putative lipoprotein
MRAEELGLRWALTGAAVLVGVGMVGCAATPAPASAGTGGSPVGTSVYTCPDGYRFSARTRGDSVIVALPERTLTRPRVTSAPGARYERAGAAFSTNGDQANLKTDTALHDECDGVRAATPWEEAALLGVEFRAVGQEPGWTLELDQGRWLRFIGDYGKTHVLTPAPDAVRDTTLGTVTYTARTEAHTLVMVAQETPCRDAMSGDRLSHTVTVRVDGRELRGCGKPLPSGDLRNTYGKLTQLGGIAAVVPSGQREAHLRFDSEGRQVNGTTGCNTLSGPVVLDKQRMRLGPLVTTRVACTDTTLTRQEREFLRALEALDHFTVADGHLTLYGSERPLARFEAVYFR